MDVLVERVAGLDVGKEIVVVCVRTPGEGGRRVSETRSFRTMSRSLQAMADWLVECGVTLAGMESTATYWKPVFYALEDRMGTWLLNATHMKAVPGRKSDVKDAEWIAQLLEHGLVAPSFVPAPPIRRLRNLTRYRVQLMGDRTRDAVRLEQILEDASIKLSAVASSVTTVSARSMLAELVAGNRDAAAMADLAHSKMRRKIPDLIEALTSRRARHQESATSAVPLLQPVRRPEHHGRRQVARDPEDQQHIRCPWRATRWHLVARENVLVDGGEAIGAAIDSRSTRSQSRKSRSLSGATVKPSPAR